MLKYISKKNREVYELNSIAEMMVAAEEYGGELYWRSVNGDTWKIEKIKNLLIPAQEED